MTDTNLGAAAGGIFAKAFTLGYETGRLIPDGGMALTAEQVEDVRALVWLDGRRNFDAFHRLRALFPATEPAEETAAEYVERTRRLQSTTLPTPAEPAEEETKAEYPHRGLGDLTVLGPEIFTNGEVINWRGENFMRQQDPASSPVVPAPTETGPWQDISEAPKHLTLIDRVGDKWTYDGDNWITPETAILPVLYINRKYAPFVAAEEAS